MIMKGSIIASLLLLALAACSPQVPVSDITQPAETLELSVTQTPLSTEIPVPLPPPLPGMESPTLINIQFLDIFNGWGIAENDGGKVLRTVDGGSAWFDATPPDAGAVGYTTTLEILDQDTVWVLVPNEDFFTGRLYHTTDGGISWLDGDVPFGGAILDFVDPMNGIAMADRGVGLGSNSVEIFQTRDGGQTWLSVFNNDPTRADSSDTLPLSGIKNGMTFLDAITGWVTGSRPMDGDIYLFLTRDGGASWTQQSLPLPPGYDAYQYLPQAPLFFDQQGVIPLLVYSDPVRLTFFTSQDGGRNWSGDPGSESRLLPPGRFSFADASHGWSWDGGERLYSTSDGALTWTAIPTGLELEGNLSSLVFVPHPAGGYRGWALSPSNAGTPARLYRTEDGGATWEQLLP